MSETSGSEGAMRVDTDMVQTLAHLLSENDLTEIEVVDGDRRIAVRRNIPAAPAPAPAPAAPSAPAPAPSAPAAPAATPADAAAAHPGVVPSPMVGTAYLSAEPGSKPFASLGERVEVGDTLLIIEAMKVMNQVQAPHAGTVTRILVQNAEPVEFGQPLVIIE
ncbi:MAG TPA: acetyl-CoA carboxylase biotin carboxyl carrier protein [Allosphingosinicella sp.]|jgi:acetyl-CoA carboxylase biotin carboxyl carrier protein